METLVYKAMLRRIMHVSCVRQIWILVLLEDAALHARRIADHVRHHFKCTSVFGVWCCGNDLEKWKFFQRCGLCSVQATASAE